MSVEIADPTQAVIVTDSARHHFSEQSRKANGAAIYLKLKESGCTGYMYVLDMVDSEPADITPQILDDGVLLYLDKPSLTMMRGTTIDYVRNGLNSELQFNNPNAQEYCGCGESFSINPGAA
jgi:iron-sulfur cluster assembly accessory protein